VTSWTVSFLRIVSSMPLYGCMDVLLYVYMEGFKVYIPGTCILRRIGSKTGFKGFRSSRDIWPWS
jgi:hypothetical protein